MALTDHANTRTNYSTGTSSPAAAGPARRNARATAHWRPVQRVDARPASRTEKGPLGGPFSYLPDQEVGGGPSQPVTQKTLCFTSAPWLPSALIVSLT